MNSCHVKNLCRYALQKQWNARSISVLRPSIDDESSAKSFVNSLDAGEREHLHHALTEASVSTNGNTEMNRKTLALEALYAGVPFFGFGFLDNTIMLSAGEYIDLTLGATLGISTLASAAMGNLISDVAGIGMAGTVERHFKKILGRSSVLTATQRETAQAHRWVFAGRCIGIAIGCILGMWPLLLLSDDESKGEEVDNSSTDTSS